MVVIFGVIIYIHMADVTFEIPMMRTKRLIIETMEHKMGGKNVSDDDNNNNKKLIIPRISETFPKVV